MAIESLTKMAEGVSARQQLGMAIVSFLLLLMLFLRRRSSTISPRLPPSPRSDVPFVGHLFALRRVLGSTAPLRLLFGPIFTLRLGSFRLIFITSASLAREALVVHGSRFASRPTGMPSRALFSSNFRNINSSYGPHWRAMRRNLVHEMLSYNKLLSFKPVRKMILDALIRRLHDHAQNNQGVVAVYSNCDKAMFRLLFFMCLGFHLDDDTIAVLSDLVLAILRDQRIGLSDFFPWLRVLEWRKIRNSRILRQRQIDTFASLIERHKELRKMGKLTPGSYLETLLSMNDVGESNLSPSDLTSLCSEFVVAGTDTTVNCMEWTMARLVKDPEIQSKLYDEIDQVVGSRRAVEEDDLGEMRFLQATVKETLRLHPPGHYLLPHAVTEPCKLAGYDIPVDAIVNVHVSSISKDPDVWEQPLEYRPERFLSRQVDITGSKEVTMIPFGAGRRMCPGAGLALMHVELFVARLVQEYEWTIPEPQTTVDLSEKRRFTVIMKVPLQAAIRRRASTPLSKEE